MECHTIESFVDLIEELKPGQSIAYHQGFIPLQRDQGSFQLRLKFDRLREFINLCYRYDLIEIYTKKIRDFECIYYVRLRKEWPRNPMREIAEEFDKLHKLRGWKMETFNNKLERHFRLLHNR